MGNGIELAKAYVQIVPSAEGIQGKITEVLGGESSKAGDAAGQLLGKKLVGAVAKVISAAGIGKILAESIASGGALQQSLGGVETLFKDSADKVKSYAAQAYKTVGLSANAYMEQTTSFAASLLASVSHDTNAATELANMAMVDMADNANKMGTDMQDIQNAYQGFAKQNYTMLDNLKLGYGGTQAEMQRLLQDAEKISGVHYDLGNLADMYSAIHVIQQEMDITGTTAKEATTTLTGSFSAMSAAFQNVLSSLSTGADLSAPLAALVETSKTYLVDNLLPMVGNVLAGIPEVVYSLVPQLLQSGTELVNSLASGFDEGIPEFFSNALPQLLVFTEQLRANAGSFVDAGLNLITQLLNGLIAGLPQLIAYAPDIIINLAGIINDNMPKILAEGISIVVQLAAGIVQAFPSLLANWKKIFQAILSVISAINWVSLGANILKGIGNGIKSMGSSLLEAFKGGFSSALNWIKNLPAQAVQWGKNLIKSFTNGLTGKGGAVGIGSILGTAGASIAENAKGGSKIDWAATWADANDDLANNAQAVADIAIPAYTKSGNAAATAAEKAKSAAKTVSETLLWSLQDAGHPERCRCRKVRHRLQDPGAGYGQRQRHLCRWRAGPAAELCDGHQLYRKSCRPGGCRVRTDRRWQHPRPAHFCQLCPYHQCPAQCGCNHAVHKACGAVRPSGQKRVFLRHDPPHPHRPTGRKHGPHEPSGRAGRHQCQFYRSPAEKSERL